MDIHPVQLLLVLEEQERRLFPVIVPAKKELKSFHRGWELTLANTRGRNDHFGLLGAGKRSRCSRDQKPENIVFFLCYLNSLIRPSLVLCSVICIE